MKRETKIKSLISRRRVRMCLNVIKNVSTLFFFMWINGADFIFKFCQNSTEKKKSFWHAKHFSSEFLFAPENKTGKPNFLT